MARPRDNHTTMYASVCQSFLCEKLCDPLLAISQAVSCSPQAHNVTCKMIALVVE
jgi:hypothetical protein